MKTYKGQRVQMHFIPATLSRDVDGDREVVKILDGDLKGSYAIIKWGTGQEGIEGRRYVKTPLSDDLKEILCITIGHPKLHLMR